MQDISGAQLPSSGATTEESTMLYAFSDKLLMINRQSPLSIRNIYKVHSCEKLNIIPFGYL